MNKRQLVIAIDGPAGSGKSTTARLVAQKLGYIYLDSGAMYRAATLKVLRHGIPSSAEDEIAELVRQSSIVISFSEGEQHVLLDGENVNGEIRSQEVTASVSTVAKIPKVREVLVEKQRQMAKNQSIVAEGRDMTTVVFPCADLKIYLHASLDERARRRQKDFTEKGVHLSEDTLREEINTRDKVDSSREHSPLRQADDAIVLDTTTLTIEQQVEFVLKEAQRLLCKSMKVVIDDYAGVCAGVKRAIRLVDEQLNKGSNLLALGPLIHNDVEIDRLASKGLETIDQDDVCQGNINLKEINDKKLLIRTHGIGVNLRNKLQSAGIDLLDATCPNVQRVQKLIAQYHTAGYQIVIVGKKNHPEVQGLQGHCQNKAIVISSHDDFKSINTEHKTFLVAQTTVSPDALRKVHKQLEGKIAELVVRDTTCNLINKRHQHLRNFAALCDVVLFVGGKQSSNTRILSDICRSVNKRTFGIEDVSDIKREWLKDTDKVGITGGASTPRWQLQRVQDYLENNANSWH